MQMEDGESEVSGKEIAVLLLTAMATFGCAGAPPPLAIDAPPTDDEKRALGPDAYDEYFLTTWRKCTKWASDDACRRQIYGGDDAIP